MCWLIPIFISLIYFIYRVRSNITGDLLDIPGIGPASVKKLKDADIGGESISNSYQLIGKYLSLKDDGVESPEHCEMFWQWLKMKTIASHRSAIVRAIAEKCNILIPGIYEADVYGEEE